MALLPLSGTRNQLPLALAFLAVLTPYTPGRAYAGDFSEINDPMIDCPDEELRESGPKVHSVSGDSCGKDFEFDLEIGTDSSGNPITYDSTGCPEFILIIPKQKVAVHVPNAGTMAVVVSTKPMTKKTFECTGQPLGTFCVGTGESPSETESYSDLGLIACPEGSGGTL